ncbi:MAG: HTH domain-containing protein [Rubrivivax sp.]|nr:HTH domain-containing protein [Rubrivivax sp.]
MCTVTQLLQAMSRHQGAANGVSAATLATRLGVEPRQLRKLISAAREDGIAICGRPSTGYYMPATPQELQAACEFLRRRALHSLRALSRMQRVSLPVLCGQLLLNQG